MIQISLLSGDLDQEYDDFLCESPSSLFFASSRYRILLKWFLCAQDCYLLARDELGRLVGVLPAFLKQDPKRGAVLNSLPFYGSNGAIIEHKNNSHVRKTLLNAFYALAEERRCVTTTIITSPLSDDFDFYEKNAQHTFREERIGQLTSLPADQRPVNTPLIALFHKKTRNSIRKAMKSGITISRRSDFDRLRFLIDTHHDNIRAIGGMAKPKEFFDLIPGIFRYDRDYRIYVALKDGVPIAALLLFYFNKTVEYFTPAVVADYRSFQPLSLLIFEAMQDAVSEGFHVWNWGGTWHSQESLYRFKSRWGTRDCPYYYYIRVYDEEILSMTEEQLLEGFPYFYVVPFEKLKS